MARNSSWARVVAAGFVKQVEVMEPVEIQKDAAASLAVESPPPEKRP
jgi:hypothetical protein